MRSIGIRSTARERSTRNVLTLAAGLCAMFMMAAHNADAADLLEAYRLAQAHDAQFESARYLLDAGREKIPQARAGLLPTLNLTANPSRSSNDVRFDDGPETRRGIRNSGWNLQLNQPLVRAQNWFGYRQSGALVDQAEAAFSEARQDLILRVAQAYFDVLAARAGIEVAESQLRAVEQQSAQVKRSYEAGAVTITDIHEAQSRYELARVQRAAAQSELTTRQAELERIIGPLPPTLAGLPDHAQLPRPMPDNVQVWIDQARESHPRVRMALAAVEVAEKEVSKMKAEHWPTLDLVASYGGNRSTGSLTSPADFETRTRSGVVGVQLNVPLFAGGLVSSKVREADANRSAQRAQLEVARREAAVLARQSYAGLTDGLMQSDALQLAVDASAKAVEASKAGYRLGTRINIDILNAEQQLHAARRDLARARYDTLIQALKLKAAAGSLEEADLTAVNGLLDVAGARAGAQINIKSATPPTQRETKEKK